MFELYESFPKYLTDMLTLRQSVYSSKRTYHFYHYVNLLLLLIASTLNFRYFASKKWNSLLNNVRSEAILLAGFIITDKTACYSVFLSELYLYNIRA